MRALESEIATTGVFLSVDSATRQAYGQQIATMAKALRSQVNAGTMTWGQAAVQAQEARNAVMEVLRARNTPVGRAVAEAMKRNGRTMNELIARKTLQLYGRGVAFDRLSSTARNRIFAEIVESAGRSNLRITLAMQRLSYAGRGLVLASLAISLYSVYTSEDHLAATERELTVTGAGIAGGTAGGALAGLACGPAAPVCVTVGAFVGGALAAFGVGLLW